MKRETPKQAKINRKKKAAYQRIDSTRDQFTCEGCGRVDKPLSHSHTISIDDAKGLGKPELIWDEENIFLECFYGNEDCHNIWESGSVEKKAKMLNFCQRMDYLAIHDPRRYNAIVVKLDELETNEWEYELEQIGS